jgi:hypothetical protein
MTNKSAQRKYKLYKALSKTKHNILGDVLEHLSDTSTDDLCECVYNVIKTDLGLPAKTRKKLRQKLLQKCSKKNLDIITSKKIPVSKRKKALSQEGAGIGLILGTVVPLLAQLLFNRKK